MTMNPQIRSKASRRTDSGYVMLTLILAMALMAIFAAVIVPSITFEIRRDREEEMIHRGVQYSRAIRAYYKNSGAIRPRSKIWKTPTTCGICANATKIPSAAKTENARTSSCCTSAMSR